MYLMDGQMDGQKWGKKIAFRGGVRVKNSVKSAKNER